MALEELRLRETREEVRFLLEQPPLARQERGRRSLHQLFGLLNDRGVQSELTRLRWVETLSSDDDAGVKARGDCEKDASESLWSSAVHACVDPAGDKAVLLRVLAVPHERDALSAVRAAYDLHDHRHVGVAHVLSAYAHKLEGFGGQAGACDSVFWLVAVVTEQPKGGTLLDALSSSSSSSSRRRRRRRRDSALEEEEEEDDDRFARQIAAWFAQLCEALASLHARGVLHRNLAPACVLIDARGRAVLDDFMFSREPRAPGRAVDYGRSDYGGVPGGVAPELESGEGAVSPKADVFALGCLVYHCITGTLPPLRSQTLKRVLADIPRRFASLLHALELALQPDPSHRADARDIATLLSPATKKNNRRPRA